MQAAAEQLPLAQAAFEKRVKQQHPLLFVVPGGIDQRLVVLRVDGLRAGIHPGPDRCRLAHQAIQARLALPQRPVGERSPDHTEPEPVGVQHRAKRNALRCPAPGGVARGASTRGALAGEIGEEAVQVRVHRTVQVGEVDRKVGLVGLPQPADKLLSQPVEFADQIRREPGYHRSAVRRGRYLDHGLNDIPDAATIAARSLIRRAPQCTMVPPIDVCPVG